jgi:hypothetical protein
LALAATLLELELETKIIPGDEDIDGPLGHPPLYLAVSRLHEDLKDNVDAYFYEIIEGCLQLYADSWDMDRTDYNSKIQIRLLNEVINPLAKRYELLRQPFPHQSPVESHWISTGVEGSIWQSRSAGGSDRRMNAIAEATEEQCQFGPHLITASFTSLSISEAQLLTGTVSIL